MSILLIDLNKITENTFSMLW